MRNPLRRFTWLERSCSFYFLLAGCAYACLSFGELYRYVLEPTIFYTKFAEFFPDRISHIESFYALHFPEEHERYVVMIASIGVGGPFLGIAAFIFFYKWIKKEVAFYITEHVIEKCGKFDKTAYIMWLSIMFLCLIGGVMFVINHEPSMGNLSKISSRAGFATFVFHFYASVAFTAYFLVVFGMLVGYILYPSKVDAEDCTTP